MSLACAWQLSCRNWVQIGTIIAQAVTAEKKKEREGRKEGKIEGGDWR
jgi:hypothetical protein